MPKIKFVDTIKSNAKNITFFKLQIEFLESSKDTRNKKMLRFWKVQHQTVPFSIRSRHGWAI